MNIAISSLVFILLIPVELYGRMVFECPPPDQIHPCTCSTHPRKIVKCDDVKNLAIVQRALENRFQMPLPTLQITNVHTFQLPHHAFRNISAKKLVLKGSSFREIDDEAFDGQDSLGLLILSEDRLTEFPTEALKRLSNLQSLSLAGNFLMKIDNDSLDNLSNLKSLVLSDNRLSSIENNSFPRSLRYLYLSRNLITSLNETVKDLHNLEALAVSNNRLVSVRGEFEGLPSLWHLSLERNNIRDISESFVQLKSLRALNLAYNNLDRVEDGLLPLTKLRNLNLSYNYITHLNEDFFKEVNSIEILDLSGNYIQDICQSLKPLTRLRELYLSNTNIKDLDFDCFQNMRNLRNLDLSHNELTNINAITAHSLPNLMFLNLQNNLLQNFRHGLKNIKYLVEFDISDNRFSSIKGHHFLHNTDLRTFKIEGNPWDCTDHLIDVLRDLEAKPVEIIGAPLCYLSENTL